MAGTDPVFERRLQRYLRIIDMSCSQDKDALLAKRLYRVIVSGGMRHVSPKIRKNIKSRAMWTIDNTQPIALALMTIALGNF